MSIQVLVYFSGNSVILKPSEVAENTAQLLENLFPLYFDKVINVCTPFVLLLCSVMSIYLFLKCMIVLQIISCCNYNCSFYPTISLQIFESCRACIFDLLPSAAHKLTALDRLHMRLLFTWEQFETTWMQS